MYTYRPEPREICRTPTIKELYEYRSMMNSNRNYRDYVPVIDKLIDQIVVGMNEKDNCEVVEYEDDYV